MWNVFFPFQVKCKRYCSIFQNVGCKHRVGPAHMLGSKLTKWACFFKLPKSACHSLAVTLACGTRWNWRRWKERSKAIWPWVKSWSKRAIRPFWEKHKWELQKVQSKEIERNIVRVWESEIEKRNIFFAQVTYKEDKLVEFSWSFWVLQP